MQQGELFVLHQPLPVDAVDDIGKGHGGTHDDHPPDVIVQVDGDFDLGAVHGASNQQQDVHRPHQHKQPGAVEHRGGHDEQDDGGPNGDRAVFPVGDKQEDVHHHEHQKQQALLKAAFQLDPVQGVHQLGRCHQQQADAEVAQLGGREDNQLHRQGG